VAPTTVPIIRNQPLRCEAELRLTYDRRGRAGPKWVIKLEPERDEEGETDRSTQPNAKEQRLTPGGQRICQLLPNRGDAALVCIQPYSGSPIDAARSRPSDVINDFSLHATRMTDGKPRRLNSSHPLISPEPPLIRIDHCIGDAPSRKTLAAIATTKAVTTSGSMGA
jgi:hypothetical protein